jgi:hypothetical protein
LLQNNGCSEFTDVELMRLYCTVHLASVGLSWDWDRGSWECIQNFGEEALGLY